MIAVAVGFAAFFPMPIVVPIGIALCVGSVIVGVVLLATYVPTRRALALAPREAIGGE
jgi:ABC-type antimicrobial peptide transport system permease subunit